jgi:phage terminase large subunit
MPKVIIDARIRWYQAALHKYLVATPRARAIEIAHRRWGKDEVVLKFTCQAALTRVASYWHCLPEYEQARKALWTAVNPITGVRRIDEAFPPILRESKDEQAMFIRLKNGSTWQLIGSDRYNQLVGAGVAGVVFSEWALANPSAWGYIRPMIEENNGWAVFITTPRGRNHAYAMYQMAKNNPRWFAELSTIEDTKALSAEALAEARAEYIALYGEDMGQAHFQQEYYCSFNAAILGAFYAREMAAVRSSGRIRNFEPIGGIPIHRAWDIGVRDDTSIWWFQVVGGTVYIIDCYTNHGAGVEHYAAIIRERGWGPAGDDFVPQDAKVMEWGSDRTRVEAMIAHGLKPRVVPRHDKLDGINAARITLGKAIFHPRCEEHGISALEQYRREWNDERKQFNANEFRDWTTHLADAFRYLAMGWKEFAPSNESKPDPIAEMLKPLTWNQIIEEYEAQFDNEESEEDIAWFH